MNGDRIPDIFAPTPLVRQRSKPCGCRIYVRKGVFMKYINCGKGCLKPDWADYVFRDGWPEEIK